MGTKMGRKDNEEAMRMDCIIDCMNTLRFLCKLPNVPDSWTPNYERVNADVDRNRIMIYDDDYFFDVCVALDRMPVITEEESESIGVYFKATAFYRGNKIYTYFNSEDEVNVMRNKIKEYEENELQRMEEAANDEE